MGLEMAARYAIGFTVSKALQGQRQGAVDGVLLIEARCNLVDQWKESCGGGVALTEAVLGVGEVDEGSYFSVEKPLQHFGGWAEERNGTVGCALVLGFPGFLKGDDYCLFPD